MKIILEQDKCYACRTCELICSFHHTRAFWPEQSSIHVFRNYQNGNIYWNIDSTCDNCKKCVEYCTYGALKISNENGNRRGN
jgi:formate hydrogenlyase subunit 6/NADH:ubiquinone oxidoreductase subunit I